MSHYIDTNQAPHGGLGKLSVRQTLEIIVGVLVVIALGVAAFAYVNTTEPIASSGSAAGTAPLTMVAHSALDPFETQNVSPQVQATIGATARPATLTIVTHSALDPFEAQHVSPQVRAAIGTETAPLAMLTHSALDPFETQYVSPPGVPDADAPSQPAEEGSSNALPEFR
ncbi:MAG: hypothetical protein M3092_04310 [Actinomycetia bacterium]|nr:hypothetical protein [Actinomycetes bacterium]